MRTSSVAGESGLCIVCVVCCGVVLLVVCVGPFRCVAVAFAVVSHWRYELNFILQPELSHCTCSNRCSIR